MTLNEKLLNTPKLFSRENDIIQWGIDRNIIGDTAQGTFEGQQEKTRQEWQEWKDNHTKDDIGDVFVTLVMQCALRETVVSNPFTNMMYDSTKVITPYYKTPSENLDTNVSFLLGDVWTSDHMQDLCVALVVSSLNECAIENGWTLEECINEAWDDIKDRKGLMVHGTFVKQSNIDTLESVGVEFDKELQAFTGEDLLYCEAHKASIVMTSLGLDTEVKGDEVTGFCIKTTGTE